MLQIRTKKKIHYNNIIYLSAVIIKNIFIDNQY